MVWSVNQLSYLLGLCRNILKHILLSSGQKLLIENNMWVVRNFKRVRSLLINRCPSIFSKSINMWSNGLCQLQMFEKAAKHLSFSSSWPFRLVNMTSKTRTQMIISINWHCPIMVINHNKKYAMLELVDVSDVNDNHLMILIVCMKVGSQAESNMCFCLTLHWRLISSSSWSGWPSQTKIIIVAKTMIIIVTKMMIFIVAKTMIIIITALPQLPLYNIFLHFVHFGKEEVSWWTYKLLWQSAHFNLADEHYGLRKV